MKHILSIAIFAAVAAFSASAQGQRFDDVQKLAATRQLIERFYVDTVNGTQITDEAIRAMLRTLDPHSTYTDAEETRAFTEPLQGNFSGIGIQFNMLDDTVRVIQTVAGGPSEKVGVQPGDRIMAVNDTVISGIKLPQNDAVKQMRGPKGSMAVLSVLRRGVADTLRFNVVRDDIPTYSVSSAYMVDPTTGYIKVTLFAETTPEEIRDAVVKLKKQGMRDLIIDLQDNGGGILGAAVEMAGLFLNKGDLIVYTEGRNAPSAKYYNEHQGIMTDGRLVVAVNQFSASAAEIFAGAMQDNDRGVVVGRRTFGKGLVQRPYPFADGSMIRLTVQRYYTPSGRCIQKPYTAGDEDAYNADMMRRYRGGEFTSADSVHFADSLRCETLRLHRTVYGGGGIMPDVFVPIDTAYYSDYYRDLVARSIIPRFCNEYIDNNRAQLKRLYPTENAFIDRFDVDSAMLDSITSMATRDGLPLDSVGYQTSLPAIRSIVKGLIGRDLFEQSTYYRAVNHLDPIFRRSRDLLMQRQDYTTILPQ